MDVYKIFSVRRLLQQALRRRVLYPAELYGRVWYMIIARSKSNCNPLFSFFWGGRCNATLGGPRYIHLTKETNAVFSGFSALLAPAAISMNSITLVMNFHCILFWHSGQSLLESNSDLSLLNFHKSQPWLNLRRRLLYPFNYENECRIFGLFSHFGSGNHIYESNHFRDELPLFLIPTSQATFLESNSKLYPFCFSRV